MARNIRQTAVTDERAEKAQRVRAFHRSVCISSPVGFLRRRRRPPLPFILICPFPLSPSPQPSPPFPEKPGSKRKRLVSVGAERQDDTADRMVRRRVTDDCHRQAVPRLLPTLLDARSKGGRGFSAAGSNPAPICVLRHLGIHFCGGLTNVS